MTDPLSSDIAKIRANIDAIDDQLMALLHQRSEFVKKVGAIKKNSQPANISFIRSGREAEMLRRIVALAQGTFPALAAAQMWRTIISASLSLEAPLHVAAFATESMQEIYWLTREYFGNCTPVTKYTTSMRVLSDIQAGKASAGALPLPSQAVEGTWWIQLPHGIKVFGCVPFVLTKNVSIKAYMAACIEPEATGKDFSLLRLETSGEVSQSRLNAALDKQKLSVRWLATQSPEPGKRLYLIETEGFITAESEAMHALKNEIGASLLAIGELGAYAAPILL